MTILRDEIHRVVDQLPETEPAPLLDYVRALGARTHRDDTDTPVWDGPDFLGAFAGGRSDVSERVDDLLFAEHPTDHSTHPGPRLLSPEPEEFEHAAELVEQHGVSARHNRRPVMAGAELASMMKIAGVDHQRGRSTRDPHHVRPAMTGVSTGRSKIVRVME